MRSIKYVQSRRPAIAGILALAISAAPASGQSTWRESVDSAGNESNGISSDPSVSWDGYTLAFLSDATDLVAGDTTAFPDVFVRDLSPAGGATTVCASVDSGGVPADARSYGPSVAALGRYVAFWSDATNLVPGDTNATYDVFVHDLLTGATDRVSVKSDGEEGNSASGYPSISGDGRYITFQSNASNFVDNEMASSNVYVHDRDPDGNGLFDSMGATTLVSVDSNEVAGNNVSVYPAISADGHSIAFVSAADNLVLSDTGFIDVFVRDMTAGTTVRVSVDSSGTQANSSSGESDARLSLSADGRLVTFLSFADNLVAGDINAQADVFVHDCVTGATTCASLDSSGTFGNAYSGFSAISADGRIVAFASGATNLVTDSDLNSGFDVFIRDLASATTWRVSVDSSGIQGDQSSGHPTVSYDGHYIMFDSGAMNLVAGDTNMVTDIFVRAECIANWWNFGIGYPGATGVPSLTLSAPPVIGTSIDCSISCSAVVDTFAIIVAGVTPVDVPVFGTGHLYVLPDFVTFGPMPVLGLTIPFAIPNDPTLCGFSYFAQVFEFDSGATSGISLSQGLEMDFGR